MILCACDCNAIMERSINSKTEEDMNEAHNYSCKLLTKKGFQPKFHRIDNELSKMNKAQLDNKNVSI